MYAYIKIFCDCSRFSRHFGFCFKPSTMGYVVYTSLKIVIFDIWWNAGHLICYPLRSEFFIFQQSYTSDFAMLVHTHLRYTDILVGGVWYIILRIMLFFLLLRFVNLTRLDLKENVLFFFFTNWDILSECSQL